MKIMNTKLIALTCTLTAAACGNSSARPAQDASSGTSAAATNQSPIATVVQPVSVTSNDAVEPHATDDKPATGASAYVAAAPPTPIVAKTSGVADGTKNAENTKTNSRDRQDTLTPMNQGNSAAETTITANIRKGIVGDKTVSFTGKNVKIVTIGTRVTLRGPVKSDTERATIEGIAKRTAGVSDVDNQLEISN